MPYAGVEVEPSHELISLVKSLPVCLSTNPMNDARSCWVYFCVCTQAVASAKNFC